MKCTASKKIYGIAIAFSLAVNPGVNAARQAEREAINNDMLPVSFDSEGSNALHDLFQQNDNGSNKPANKAESIDDIFFSSPDSSDKAVDELNMLNEIYLASVGSTDQQEYVAAPAPADKRRLLSEARNDLVSLSSAKKQARNTSYPIYSVKFEPSAADEKNKQRMKEEHSRSIALNREQVKEKRDETSRLLVNKIPTLTTASINSIYTSPSPRPGQEKTQTGTDTFFKPSRPAPQQQEHHGNDVYAMVMQKLNKPASYQGTGLSSSAVLDFDEAMKRAAQWHPLIKRSQEELAQSRESINEAEASYFPALDAGIKSGFEQNNYTNKNERTSKAVLTASQMIYDFGKTESQVSLAKSNTTMMAANLHKNINDIMYETASAWLQASRYKKLIAIAKAQVKGFTSINEMARKRAALGASAQSEYSQSKVRLASATSLLYDYIAQYNRWAATLSNYVNLNTVSLPDVDRPSGLENVCYRIDTHNLVSPAIEVAKNQVQVAKDQVSASRSDRYPTLSLSPTYEYKIYDDSNSYKSSNRKNGEFGVFLNISTPLYKGGALDSRMRQAEQALYAAQHNVNLAEKEAGRKIDEARSQIENTRLSLNAKKTREKEAIQTRDLYMKQYIELGTRSFSDLLSAESEIHQTKMDIANGNYSIANFSLECLYQSGQLEKRLNKNNVWNDERPL